MNSRRGSHFRPLHGRRAFAMGIALVVLLVVGLVAGLTLKAILRSHRLSREEEQRVQAELLADSALGRAMAIVNADPAWRGETWMPAVSDATDASGEAVIRVEPAADSAAVRIIVEGIYPRDPVHRARGSRDINYIIPKRGDNP